MTFARTSRARRAATRCALPLVVLLGTGCAQSRLPECQQLVSAVADGSSNAVAAASTKQSLASALLATAAEVEAVTLQPVAKGSFRAIDLATPRDAYVQALRRIPAEAAKLALTNPNAPVRSAGVITFDPTLQAMREALVKTTGDAIDAINVICTGER